MTTNKFIKEFLRIKELKVTDLTFRKGNQLEFWLILYKNGCEVV
jgi:hypothetical protein